MPLAGEEEGFMVLRCSRKMGGVLLRGGEWQEAQPSWLEENVSILILCPVPSIGQNQRIRNGAVSWPSPEGHPEVRDEAGRAIKGGAQVGS